MFVLNYLSMTNAVAFYSLSWYFLHIIFLYLFAASFMCSISLIDNIKHNFVLDDLLFVLPVFCLTFTIPCHIFIGLCFHLFCLVSNIS